MPYTLRLVCGHFLFSYLNTPRVGLAGDMNPRPSALWSVVQSTEPTGRRLIPCKPLNLTTLI